MSNAKSIRDRFAAPWAVEEIEAAFRVLDKNGAVLAYVYATDELTRSSMSMALTAAEARAIAQAIAHLPEIA